MAPKRPYKRKHIEIINYIHDTHRKIQQGGVSSAFPEVKIRFDKMFTLEFARPTYVENRGKTSEKVSEKTSEKILRLVAESQGITIVELSEIIGATTRSIERNLKKLQTEGRLRRVGADKGGYLKIVNK